MESDESKELQRLTLNHHSLLNIWPELVILACRDGNIEYMNPNGTTFFNHLASLGGQDKLQRKIHNLIKKLLHSKKDENLCVVPFSDLFFECRIAPFMGYKGDHLFWLTFKSLIDPPETSGKLYATDTKQSDMIGGSPIMTNLNAIITRIALTDTTVLIFGESGTGKELVANLLKSRSNRSNKPFLTINCTTINDLLLESELFGYEKGAFTGADKQRKGKFEIVDGGTIFLDEIGDISPRMQAALLRVLQNGEITRVGGHTPIKTDVRIIAATNKDLTAAVQKGTFRLDLYYRLNVINIIMPSLREKIEDVAELTIHFLKKYNHLFKKNIAPTPQNILAKLEKYHWPGNVRELENVIHRAVLMCQNNILDNEDITFDMPPTIKKKNLNSMMEIEQYREAPLKRIITNVEKEIIIAKLKHHRGNVAKAAESLEISKAAIYDKMRKYGIMTKSIS